MKRLLYSLITVIATLGVVILPMHLPVQAASDSIQVDLNIPQGTSSPPSSPGDDDSDGGGSADPFSLTFGSIAAGDVSAVITFTTSELAQGSVAYGPTPELMEGSITETDLSKDHAITLIDLEPSTDYYVQITATDEEGTTLTLDRTFTTMSAMPADLPVNVENFRASPSEVSQSIWLSWKNPTNEQMADFSYVRVVRSENFFPTEPLEGRVVYEGPGEFVEDADIITDKRYYYAIFTRGSAGQWSSGALDGARLSTSPQPPSAKDDLADDRFDDDEDPFEDLPDAPDDEQDLPEITGLDVRDFYFYQDGQPIGVHADGTVLIDGAKSLTILLPYEAVPEVLKTIAVTVTHPDNPNRKFRFLLRVNEDKTAYTTTVAPLTSVNSAAASQALEAGATGTYPLEFTILNYRTQVLTTFEGELMVTGPDEDDTGTGLASTDLSFPFGSTMMIFLILLALILLVLVIRQLTREQHSHA